MSQNVTAKDHTLVLDQPMIYPMALEKAQEVAGLRKSKAALAMLTCP